MAKKRKPKIEQLQKILDGPAPEIPVENLLSPAKKMSIAELTRLLNSEEERDIEILPNGEVRASKGKKRKGSPLTFRENLGGEYGSFMEAA